MSISTGSLPNVAVARMRAPGPRARLADVALGGDQHCAGAVGDAARVAGGVKVPDLLRGRVRDDGDLIERLAIASGRL